MIVVASAPTVPIHRYAEEGNPLQNRKTDPNVGQAAPQTSNRAENRIPNRAPSRTDTDSRTARDGKKSRRRMMRILLICLIAAAILITALEIFLRMTEDPAQNDPRDLTYVTDNRNLSFYEPQPDVDIFTDEAWLDEDRYLYFFNGVEGMILTEERNEAGIVGELFLNYFSALMHGDAAGYATLFTEEYRADAQLPEYFTMQRVYDIKVTKTLEAEITGGEYAGLTRYLFTVSYSIMRNDGTFRRDISSGGVSPQVFELLSDGTSVHINGIESVRYAN